MQLEIRQLSKTYPNGVHALAGIDLSIGNGLFGLLGPNGAGKSSLMRTLATLQLPDSGSITFGDIDVLAAPDALRRVLGYLPQEFGLYPTMSAEVTLDHFATMKGITARNERRDLVAHLLNQVNLYQVRKKHVGTFSGGMKQRLGIAIALAGAPQLLIVDEPTAGLDPTESQRFLNLIAEIGEDIVVILSTHIVEDVRELCRSMAIINKGRVLFTGDPEQIVATLQGRIWKKTVTKAELPVVQKEHHVISAQLLAGRPVVRVYADQSPGDGFKQVECDLEDVYFHQLSLVARAEGGGR